jgi:hypothetical protein
MPVKSSKILKNSEKKLRYVKPAIINEEYFSTYSLGCATNPGCHPQTVPKS